MAVITYGEVLNHVKTLIADRTDDEALKILEDVTDTMEQAGKPDEEDWKAKYEENDKAWRERYRDRFLGKDVSLPEGMESQNNSRPDNVTNEPEGTQSGGDDKGCDDLFKEKE